MARERYLLGSQEETINKSGAEITADTKKAKWDNFWFYHKWHLVIIVAACLLVGWFVHDMVSKVNPDYQIALLTQKSYSTDMVQSMQKEIAKYGKDVNGDGKVVVQINSYGISQDNTTSAVASGQQNTASRVVTNQQAEQADMVRFMADTASGTSVIFLTDDTSFNNQQKVNTLFSYLDGTTPKKGATDYDKMRVSWSKCKLLPQLQISTDQLSQSNAQKLLSDLSISMRVYSADGESEKTYYTQSKALLNKLVYDK